MKIFVKRRFATVPNEILNNPELSLAAKGLYAYIQSKSDGWHFSIERMRFQLKEGKTAIQSAVKELEDAGYLIRKPNRDKLGRFGGYDYILFDTPQKTLISLDLAENPSAENQPADFTSAENSATISKKDNSKKDNSKKDIKDIDCPEVCNQVSNDTFLPADTSNKEPSKSAYKREEITFNEEAMQFEGVERFIPLWKDAYPLVDVETELKQMVAWVMSQPKSRWKKDWKRFVVNWLSREQGKAEMRASGKRVQHQQGPMTVDELDEILKRWGNDQ